MVEPKRVVAREDFVRELDVLRQKAGLTIRQVAKIVDAPHGTIGGYFSGRHFPGPAQTELFVRILAACGVTTPTDIEQWVDTLVQVRRPVGRRAAGVAPYRGLECFQTDHGDWFFGREALTEELLARLTTGSGPLMVVGPSGAGKSSLLRAGLCAALSRREGTRCVVFTPGAHPARTLERHVADAAGDGLVLVVDQVEEIFTLCADDAERHEFVAALAEAPARVVVGMRADFYAQALRHTQLAAALQTNQLVVRPMSEPELRRAIAEPARKANLDLEVGLVELLLHELGTAEDRDAGALPLLSHALLATWERGSRGRMAVEDYRATGGISGAVAQTAEAVYANLTSAQQDAARRLFLRLVHVGEDTADTRRRVHHDELASPEVGHVLDRYVEQRLLTVDADTVHISHEALIMAWPRLREWIDADRAGLRIHRQLTESAQAWLEGDRDEDALYRGSRLAAATEWVADRTHRTDLNALEWEFLDAGNARHRAELAQVRRRTRRLYQLLAILAVLTLLAGTLAVVARQQTSRANHERDLAVSRQVAITANRLREYDPSLAAQLSLSAYRIAPTIEARSSLIASSGAPMVTRMVRPGGTRQVMAVSPDGRLLAGVGAAEADESDTAVLLWDMSKPQAPRRLDVRLTGHTKAVYAAAFSQDGRVLATGGADDTVRLWNVADPERPTPLGAPLTGTRVLGMRFSPDGTMLAVGGGDKTVRLWDVRDPAAAVLIGQLTGATGDVQAVTFRPDGRMVAAADAAGAVLLWDISDPRQPRTVSAPLRVPSIVNTVAFTPDGTVLVAGSHDWMVRFWTVSDSAPPVPLGEPLTAANGRIYGATFDTPGDVLAVASADGTARLWDWRNRRMIASLPHQEPITSVAFKDDDRLLVTNSVDGIARVWTVPGPSMPATDRLVYTVDFGPRGDLLVSTGVDVWLAELPDRNHPRLAGPPLVSPSATDRLGGTGAVSADGRLLAADTRLDNAVVLWDITDPSRPVSLGPPLTGPTETVEDLAFSPDGRLVAAAADDGAAWLWEVRGSREPVALRIGDESDFAFKVVFSPDGRTLVTTTSFGTVDFWNVTDPANPKRIGRTLRVARDIIYAAAFNSDGSVLAIGSSDGVVSLWDVRDREHPKRIEAVTGLDGHIQSVAFSADDQFLAGGNRGRIQIWRVADLRRLEPFASLDRARESTWSLEFSPDGHTLAAATGDVKLWNVDPDAVAAEICATAGDPLSETEWRKHVPGVAYRPACG